MAGRLFKSNIDLDHNQLINAALENIDVASNPVSGRIYYDTDDDLAKIYNGTTTSWDTLTNWVTSIDDTTTIDLTVSSGELTAKFVDIADDTLLGNISGTSAVPIALTANQVRTLLNVADGATANAGTVTQVDTDDGAITGGPITGTGTISHASTAGYKHIPTGGTPGQILTNTASGTVAWSAAPSGTTNLSVTSIGPTTLDIASSTGSDATIPAATTDDAGLLTAALWDKLDGIESGAEANVNTNLSIGTRTTTVMPVVSSTGNDVDLLAATTDYAGLMTSTQFDKLAGIAANANNYSHPGYNGDDIALSIATDLSGATVIDDLEITVTTDTSGHVTAASASYGTRELTAADIGAAGTGHDHGTGTTGRLVQWADTSGNLEDGPTKQTVVRADGVAVDTAWATEKAVRDAIDAVLGDNNAMTYQGTQDCSTDPNYPAASAGDVYIVDVAGNIGGASGPEVEVGDMLICHTDTVAGDHATVGEDWNIIQTNIDGAVTGPTSVATADNIAVFNGTNPNVIKDGGYTIADLQNVATDLSWTAGTTAGPQVNSSTGADAIIPSASATASGVVTTADQTFNGVKTFNSTISGSINGNAATVTNATLTTALTINTGTVTIKGNGANTSELTLGAGASSVSGSNTGDQDADEVSITDTGGIITATNVEDALQENRTAIDLNTDKVTNATHDGDVTDSSGTLTIDSDVVSNTKLANMPAYTIKGNDTAATGDPKDLTITELRSFGAGQMGIAFKEVYTNSGTTNPIDITHTLGTQDISVTIRQTNSPWHIVDAEVRVPDNTSVLIYLAQDPTDEEFTITLVG